MRPGIVGNAAYHEGRERVETNGVANIGADEEHDEECDRRERVRRRRLDDRLEDAAVAHEDE